MLVEINLLPQKEPKKFGFIIVIALLISLFLLAFAFYFWQIHLTKNTIASTNSQITTTQKVAANLANKKNNAESSNSVSQLTSVLKWADENRIPTIPVMRQLTSLLPKRGYIMSFTYQETGTVLLTVQFDSVNEAASYLDSLNSSSWIAEASITSLTAASTAQNTTGTASSSQMNSTPASSNFGNNSTNTTVDLNTTNTSVGSTSTSNLGTDSSIQNNIVPRYTGQFQIKFNQASIKKAIDKSSKAEEGVAGP
jgi:Tfp pilus assembly protein PilN